MNIARLKEKITFQRTEGQDKWEDYLTVHAYINGVSGTDYFLANAGGEASLTVTVDCRYQSALMRVVPMMYRIKQGDIVYRLESPGDDIQMRHEIVRFRAKRVYTEEDGLDPEDEDEDEDGATDDDNL